MRPLPEYGPSVPVIHTSTTEANYVHRIPHNATPDGYPLRQGIHQAENKQFVFSLPICEWDYWHASLTVESPHVGPLLGEYPLSGSPTAVTNANPTFISMHKTAKPAYSVLV